MNDFPAKKQQSFEIKSPANIDSIIKAEPDAQFKGNIPECQSKYHPCQVVIPLLESRWQQKKMVTIHPKRHRQSPQWLNLLFSQPIILRHLTDSN
jgi:hypothetical protein